MNKAAFALLLVLCFANALDCVVIFHPIRVAHGESSSESPQITTFEEVNVSKDGTAHFAIFLNVSSSLADAYRRMLATPADAHIGEEMPIPENTTEKIKNDINSTDVQIPVRQEFYKSITKEQLLWLGLRTEISNSRMIPREEANECKIFMAGNGAFENTNVTIADCDETWEIGVGPSNATGVTGFALTKLMFTQMLLESQRLNVCRSSWYTTIRLPMDASFLNCSELEGLNWTVDFGGGSCLNASVSLDQTAAVVLDEDFIITTENMTATPEYLCQAFSRYKVFSVRYSLPYDPSEQHQNGETNQTNTNWSYKFETGWMQLPEIPVQYNFGKPNGTSINLKLTLSPKINIAEEIGWQFYCDLRFPFVHTERFWAGLNFSTSLKITFEASLKSAYSFEWNWTLSPWRMPFYFYYGMPCWVDVVFSVEPRLSIAGSCTFIVETVVNGTLQAGVSWDNVKGWSQIHTLDISPDRNLTNTRWQFAVHVSVVPSIAFRSSFLFYSVAGPYAEFELKVTVQADLVLPDKRAWWSISFDFSINAGVTFAGWLRSVLGLGDWAWTDLVKVHLIDFNGTNDFEAIIPNATHGVRIGELVTASSVVLTDIDLEIEAIMMNIGDFTETANVTFLQDDVLINQTSINLNPGEPRTLVLSWNTGGRAPRNYTLSVRVQYGIDETDIQVRNVTLCVVDYNDISISKIAVTPGVIYAGQPVNVTVTLRNLGNITEDVALSVNCNTTTVFNQVVNGLKPKEERAIILQWNTTGLGGGNTWVIWANVSTVHYDVNAANNVLLSETNTVKMSAFYATVGGSSVLMKEESVSVRSPFYLAIITVFAAIVVTIRRRIRRAGLISVDFS